MSTDVYTDKENGVVITHFQGPKRTDKDDRTMWQLTLERPGSYTHVDRPALQALAIAINRELRREDDARLYAIERMGDEFDTLLEQVKMALEGDSNDDEHDALAAVAGFFRVEYCAPDDVMPEPSVADLHERMLDAMQAAGVEFLSQLEPEVVESVAQFDEYLTDCGENDHQWASDNTVISRAIETARSKGKS